MPIFEYECRKCLDRVELFQSKPRTIYCSQCAPKRVVMQRIPTAGFLKFAGGGWSADNYSKETKK